MKEHEAARIARGEDKPVQRWQFRGPAKTASQIAETLKGVPPLWEGED